MWPPSAAAHAGAHAPYVAHRIRTVFPCAAAKKSRIALRSRTTDDSQKPDACSRANLNVSMRYHHDATSANLAPSIPARHATYSSERRRTGVTQEDSSHGSLSLGGGVKFGDSLRIASNSRLVRCAT